jgi:hypothetical protein
MSGLFIQIELREYSNKCMVGRTDESGFGFCFRQRISVYFIAPTSCIEPRHFQHSYFLWEKAAGD